MTIQFSTTSAKLTNIQNAAGTAAGGLNWGIIIDSNGNGFSEGGSSYLGGFAMPSGGGTYLSNSSGIVTDDYFYRGSTNNTTTASATGTDAGTNLITTISSVPFGVNDITTGDRYALIWFDTGASTASGAKYGFLTDASALFAMPADGATVQFTSANSSPFSGADPVRLASNTFAAVPEPSRMILLGFGLVGVFFRRRR